MSTMFNIRTTGPVNIRSGPGMGFDVVKQHPTNHMMLSKEIKTDGGGNMWYKVKDGWLSANYAVQVKEQMRPTRSSNAGPGVRMFAADGGGDSTTKPTDNAPTTSGTPFSDTILKSSIHAQQMAAISNPSGGIATSVLSGGGISPSNNSDAMLKKRIYGVPYQFMDTVDARPSIYAEEESEKRDVELGTHFLQMMAEAPVVSVLPGRPNFLPDMEEESKKQLLSELDQASKKVVDSVEEKAQEAISATEKDMRYFEFVSDHSTYIRYVNTLCRMNAVMMGLGNETVPGYEGQGDAYQFKNYDWSGYRLSNQMAGRSVQGSYLTSANNGISSLKDIVAHATESYKKAKAEGKGVAGAAVATVADFNLTEYYIDFYINPSIGYSESFSNATKESIIAGAIGHASDMAKELAFLLGTNAVKADGNFAKASKTFADETGKALDSIFPGGGGGFIKKIIGNSASILSGSNMMFPELWASSDYSRSYSIEIDLKTPYGNKKNIFLDLFVPMWHWIALTAPRQTTPNTYGAPFLCKAHVPGMFSTEMSMVESLTIQKGGDGSAWSIDGYPLEIKLQINLKDLYNSFSMSKVNSFDEAYNMLWNHALIEYAAVQSGLNLKLPEYKAKLDVAEALASGAMTDLYQYTIDSLRESLARGVRVASGKI